MCEVYTYNLLILTTNSLNTINVHFEKFVVTFLEEISK